MRPELHQTLITEGFGGYTAVPVSGGDINDCFMLVKGKQQYFLKVNESAKFPEMFAMEYASLKYLAANTDFKIPEVIHHYAGTTYQWLMLEWIERGYDDKSYWVSAGEKLAEMHRKTHNSFGWPHSNFIGSLTQLNTAAENWAEFYSANRLLPLALKLHDAGMLTGSDIKYMECLCDKLFDLFPDEAPALLHGDLWNGNVMPSLSSGPCIYDPAVYFGHREMDIGMTLLFGGFSKEFYDAYQSVYPLREGWEQRVALTQLYPLLVHAVLFGGSYVTAVKNSVKLFL